MTVEIRRITEVSDALEEAFARLMPQLSPRLGAPSREVLRRVAGSETGALLAAVAGERIVGVLTLAWYDAPSGRKAWIEDVVVDGAAAARAMRWCALPWSMRPASAPGR